MTYFKLRRLRVLTLLVSLTGTLGPHLCSTACADDFLGVATFAGYSEGSRGIAFTDPASGIRFFNPIQHQGPTVFTTDFGNVPGYPTTMPGTYLTGTGVSPGSAASFAVNFGFDLLLPIDASLVQLTTLYVTSGQVTYGAFNGANELVASTIANLSGQGEHIITLQPSSAEQYIRSVQIRSTGGIGTGYDNIAYTPEPTSSLVIVSLIIAWSCQRLRTRHEIIGDVCGVA